jgi:DNA polymerase III epsilon subunit-like protein
MNSYLFLDTETGGLDPRRHSLLSLGLVAGDSGGIAERLEILVRHETYGVTGGGLKVNRIDLAEHHVKALEPSAALHAFDGFLARHFGPDAAVILVGHNIAFDRAFLGAFLETLGRDLEPRFSHRTIDTHSIAAALQDAGRIPAEVALNSSGLFAHFGIQVPEAQRHTALGDAVATFELYWKLVEVAR